MRQTFTNNTKGIMQIWSSKKWCKLKRFNKSPTFYCMKINQMFALHYGTIDNQILKILQKTESMVLIFVSNFPNACLNIVLSKPILFFRIIKSIFGQFFGFLILDLEKLPVW